MIDGRLARTLSYYGAFVCLGLALASLGPTLPGLAEMTAASLSSISAIFIARSSGYLSGALFCGRLFDRFPGHPLLAFVLTAIAVCMALVPLSTSLAVLILVFVLLGIAEGTLDVGGNTLLARLYPTGLGPWMNGLHLLFGVGALLSPLLVSLVYARGGSVAYAYWLLAALMIPAVLLIAIQRGPPITRHAATDSGDLHAHRGAIALIAALLFVAVGAEVGFGNWIFTYALQLNLADEAGAAVLTSAFWSAFTFGRLLGIPLSARFRPSTILLCCFLACACSAAIPLWLPQSREALWAAAILGGLAVAPMFATILSLAGSLMPLTGRATGWIFVGSSTGGMATPWVIGQFIETSGPGAIFYIILANLGLGLAVLVAKGTGAADRH